MIAFYLLVCGINCPTFVIVFLTWVIIHFDSMWSFVCISNIYSTRILFESSVQHTSPHTEFHMSGVRLFTLVIIAQKRRIHNKHREHIVVISFACTQTHKHPQHQRGAVPAPKWTELASRRYQTDWSLPLSSTVRPCRGAPSERHIFARCACDCDEVPLVYVFRCATCLCWARRSGGVYASPKWRGVCGIFVQYKTCWGWCRFQFEHVDVRDIGWIIRDTYPVDVIYYNSITVSCS